MARTENDNLYGAKETMKSPSFLKRTDERKKLFNTKKSENMKLCGNRMLYEWAEYKTSLLSVFINSNETVNFDLKIFLHKMIINILSLLNVDLHNELIVYMQELSESQNNSHTRSYHVAQSQVWIQGSNISGLWDNLYGLINFAKWIWFKLETKLGYYDKRECDDSSLNYHILITIFQQKIFNVQSVIKGARLNNNFKDKNKEENSNPYVGVSVMENEILLRKIRKNPNVVIEPWIHPGSKQCHVPYFGGYGQLMKEYRENGTDNSYSSLLCGPSGSVNYFFFLHLLSNIIAEDKSKDFSPSRLILIFVLQLSGDGGHNVREILFGLTSTIIVMFHVIKDVKFELQDKYGFDLSFKNCLERLINEDDIKWILPNTVLGHIFEEFNTKGVIDKLDECINIKIARNQLLKQLFIYVLNSLANWEESVGIFYNLTADINIIGIDQQDLIKNNLNVDFNTCKKEMYYVLFSRKSWLHDHGLLKETEQSNNVQLFFALENNRHIKPKDESFKISADEKMKNILKTMYPELNITGKIDEQLKKDFKKCYPDIEMPYIPYA
jgi:hypothetical protein